VAIDRYRPLLLVALATLVFNVALNLALIPRFGPVGAASALLASETASLIATYVVFRHLSGLRVDWIQLWRPGLAAGAALSLVAARDHVWAHLNQFAGLVVGGVLVIGVYGIVLWLVGGIPRELSRRSSQTRQAGPEDDGI
jgi:O-antigen/teichoic acid export membrane protein